MDQLFINAGNDAKGIPHFIEQSNNLDLSDSSYTTQASFLIMTGTVTWIFFR